MFLGSRGRGLALILIAVSAAASASDVPPPQSLNDAIDVTATVVSDPLRILKFGDFEAKFEDTTLDQIRERFAAGSLAHRGDAAGSIYWLCYSIPRQIIWVGSHGEMGGSEHALTNVFAEEVDASDPRLISCPSIPMKLRPPSLTFGWLGSSRTAVESALGPPSGSHGDWLQFLYEGKVPGPYRGPGETESHVVDYDVMAYIELRIHNNRVVAFHASHITSY
jgi:hypothetical protein